MLEQQNALPAAERKRAVEQGDGQLGLGERHSQMRRHVVGSFVVMLVIVAFGRNASEKSFKVAVRGWRSVLLDQQGCRRVAAEEGDEPVGDAAVAQMCF